LTGAVLSSQDIHQSSNVSSLAQKPSVLASAGFFYTGIGDRVICFYCGLGLKDWDLKDDVYKQHAIFRSWCQYIAITKGIDFVRKSLYFKPGAYVNKLQLLSTSHHPLRNPSTDCLKCLNCEDNYINTVNLPCGHMTLCTICSEKEKICIMCNNLILASVTVFMV